jgi:hypothetical protein
MTVNTWQAQPPATPQALALEIKRHAEHWLHWDRATGPVFLSDLSDFSDELLRSFKSDTAAILVSLNNERQLLLTELRSLPPNSPMAARGIKLKLRRVTRKEDTVRVLRGEATSLLHQRNIAKTRSKKKTKAQKDADKVKAIAERHSDHQALQKGESRFDARHRFELLEAFVGPRVMAQICALARSRALDDLRRTAPEAGLDQEVVAAYITKSRQALSHELEQLGCDLTMLNALYGTS